MLFLPIYVMLISLKLVVSFKRNGLKVWASHQDFVFIDANIYFLKNRLLTLEPKNNGNFTNTKLFYTGFDNSNRHFNPKLVMFQP